MHTCPVCGFDQLRYPVERHPICPCCYTEFGYDDARVSHDELQKRWIANGMRWAAREVTPPPADWNPYKQLANLKKQIEKTGADTHTEVRHLDLATGRIIIEGRRNVQVRLFDTISDLIGHAKAAHA